MGKKVTIIVYHYVRDLRRSRFPEIKGRDISSFKEQIEYIGRHYRFISMVELIDALRNGFTLPKRPVLLTFDDAYLDHYLHVFPLLEKKKIPGSFFIPVEAVQGNTVLDVNKIHFLLASVKDKRALIKAIFEKLDFYREAYKLKGNSYYYKRLAKADRFDGKEVIFIKRALQVGLKPELRKKILSSLFARYVTNDEAAFSRELYLGIEQVRCMQRHGMHFGSHSFSHPWLNSLTRQEQAKEIGISVEFLKEIGVKPDCLCISYPYGAYNEDTIGILQEQGFKAGLTTCRGIADLSRDNSLKLPTLDTNDILRKSRVK